MKEEKIKVALEYARVLLDSVGLTKWSVGVKKSFSVAATMNHDTKTILYSDRYITLATKRDFYKATMHEATHALLGKGKGHNDEFVKLYTRLNPEDEFNGRCVSFPIHKYKVFCYACNTTTSSNSNKDGWCMKCAVEGELQKLDISINKLELTEWASTP